MNYNAPVLASSPLNSNRVSLKKCNDGVKKASGLRITLMVASLSPDIVL